MSKALSLVIGAVLVVLGLIFTLQGMGYIGGSAMSGVALWSIIGPVIMVVGVIVIAVGVRNAAKR